MKVDGLVALLMVDGTIPIIKGTGQAKAVILLAGLKGGSVAEPDSNTRSKPLPTGIVTFVMSDVEESTSLWESHPDEMKVALKRHDAIAARVIEGHGGDCPRDHWEGDSTFAVFLGASDAVAYALELQKVFLEEQWPSGVSIKVRVAIHTGETEVRNGRYQGTAINRCSRLRSIAHGGQTLLSETTRNVVADHLPDGASLSDLGVKRLPDLSRPVHVYQLNHRDLPSEFDPLMSLESMPTNLPAQLTSFIGRVEELEQVSELITAHRLVTITGGPGLGKTRLALQVGADLIEAFCDGVWFIELASVKDSSEVAESIATVLEVAEAPGRDLLETVIESLARRECLLLLDSCEHIVDECAQIASAILAAAPSVKTIVSSRQALGIAGEVTLRLPPLELPDVVDAGRPDILARSPAAALFADRATLSEPKFQITVANARAVAEIVSRLDGIPLAIELAAARVSALSAEQIASRLSDRFRVLGTRSRDAATRHRTLQAALDWSFDLLTDEEKTLFVRLSVFHSHFALDAAESVCSSDGLEAASILELLSQLIDKSLVTADIGSETPYSILETLRQYGFQKLLERGESAVIRERHLTWFRDLAVESEQGLVGQGQVKSLASLESDYDNLRAALEWSLSEGSRFFGLELANALTRYWMTKGKLAEGRRWLESLLDTSAELPLQVEANAWNRLGAMSWAQDDYETAATSYKKALHSAKTVGDSKLLASVTANLGILHYMRREYANAREMYDQSLKIYTELKDEAGIASVLDNLGNVAQEEDDLDAARTYYERSLEISKVRGDLWVLARSFNNIGEVAFLQEDFKASASYLERSRSAALEIGDRWVQSRSANNLGEIKFVDGDPTAARALFEESLELSKDLRDRQGIAASLENIARLNLHVGEPNLAAQLFGAADALRRQIGFTLSPASVKRFDDDNWRLLAEMGEEDYRTAFSLGSSLSMDEAVLLGSGALATDRP